MKEQTYKNLKDIKKILDDNNISFWVECGLLLGLYRDGDIIKNDEDDADIFIWIDYMEEYLKLFNKFKELGFVNGGRNRRKQGGIRAMSWIRGGAHIDVFFVGKAFDRMEVFYSMGVIKNTNPDQHRIFSLPLYIYKNFSTIKWRDLELNCPSKIEDYLKFRYGNNWKTPILRGEGWTNPRDEKLNPCLRVGLLDEDMGELL